MAAGPRIPGTRGRRSPSGLTSTEPLAECRSVTHSTEPDHSSRAWVLDSVREISQREHRLLTDGRTASTPKRDCSPGYGRSARRSGSPGGVRCRRRSRLRRKLQGPGSRSRCGKDGGVQSRVLRQCRGGSGDSARSAGRVPGSDCVTVRRINARREARHHLRILTGLPVRSSTVRRLRARRPRVRPRRTNKSTWPNKENAAADANPRHRPECARSRRYDGNRRSDREWKRVDQRCQIAA